MACSTGIRHSDSRLDRQKLLRFVNSYQTVAPLTIGELWAWPSMLKLALIENLRRLADEMMEARDGLQPSRLGRDVVVGQRGPYHLAYVSSGIIAARFLA